MTPFGREMRILRMDRQIQLAEMAKLLGCQPSYLSSVEFGRKGRPSVGFVERICEVLDLGQSARNRLKKAAELSATNVRVPSHLAPAAYVVFNEFARSLPKLSPGGLERIRSVVRAEIQSEVPVTG